MGNVINLNFDSRNRISGTAEAEVAKFCIQVNWDDRLLPNGVASVTVLELQSYLWCRLSEALQISSAD